MTIYQMAKGRLLDMVHFILEISFESFHKKCNIMCLLFFLFLHVNICYEYSLEVPQALLMSTHNIWFHAEIRKSSHDSFHTKAQ